MKLEIALKNGKYVNIEEVDSGLKCNCICIECKKPLIAKKGKKIRHHFSHYKHSDKECIYRPETIVHRVAKNIIFESKEFRLPPINDEEGNLIVIDECKIEPIIQDKFRPDLMIRSGTDYYYIEILVSHRCSREKEEAFEKYKLNTIEIDLGSLIVDKNILENIKKIVVNDDKRKYWLYNANKKQLKSKKEIKTDSNFRSYNFPSVKEKITDYFNPRKIPLVNVKNVLGPRYCPCKTVSKWTMPLELEFDCKGCPSFKGLSDDGKFVLCTRIDSKK